MLVRPVLALLVEVELVVVLRALFEQPVALLRPQLDLGRRQERVQTLHLVIVDQLLVERAPWVKNKYFMPFSVHGGVDLVVLSHFNIKSHQIQNKCEN